MGSSKRDAGTLSAWASDMPSMPSTTGLAPGRSSPDVSEVLVRTVQHAKHLLKAEIGLAKAELRYELKRAGVGLLAFFVGGAVLLAAVCILLGVAVVALGAGMLVVGGLGVVLLCIGIALVYWGQRRLGAPSLERTRKAVTQSAVALKEMTDA